MTADLTHLAARVPDGVGNPAGSRRYHEARLARTHLQITARIVVDVLASGDEGAARRYLHSLRHDPAAAVDPWELVEAVAARALRTGAGAPEGS